MAQKSRQTRADFQPAALDEIVTAIIPFKRESRRHRQRSLGEIEEKDEDAVFFAEHAPDVARADVAAARLEDIHAPPRTTR